MAKGVPHAASGRRPAKPIIRPSRKAAEPGPGNGPQTLSEAELKALAKAKEPVKAAPPAPAPAPEVPLELLDQAVKAIEAELATGDYDQHLAALLAAEKAGKGRKTAIDVIEARM